MTSQTASDKVAKTPFLHALLPILFLMGLIIYGLMIRTEKMPLEVVFILAASYAVLQLFLTGHHWNEIQKTIVKKFQDALPAFFILFCIGLVIASWIVSGTIPMLVYYGLKMISPGWIYVVAFVAPIIFSSLTGTSWGSAGTIGVVVIGIATAIDANMGIVAGAIVGGAFFGDKLSPLSDTTNLAALAAKVDLYAHIHSMLFTTIPAALLALVVYGICGYVYPPEIDNYDTGKLDEFLNTLKGMFEFNVLLLLPVAIVLLGSLRKLPTVPVLISSILTASLLAIIFQPFSSTEVIQSLHEGFNVTMASDEAYSEEIKSLLNRGGLYALIKPIIIAFMVFMFVGALDHINAIPTVVQTLTRSVNSIRLTVFSTLCATAATNALTSNQFATSFIVGDAFKTKYNQLGIHRKVLSRSLEDTGTMLESILPWTVTAAYMVETLGVPFADYMPWQLMSLFSIAIAVVFSLTGVAIFTSKPDPSTTDNS